MSAAPERRPEGYELVAFQSLATEMWERIPDELKQGVDALVVEKSELGHPSLGEVYTLGECVTESWPSGYSEEGDLRSRLILYHGSFRALAALDTSFAWEAETWETLLHELLHHREAAAGESGLDEVDWAAEQNFRRHAGRSFDPAFIQAVPPDPDGAVRLDSEVFAPATRVRASDRARFQWRGREYAVTVPDVEETLFVRVRNLAGGRLTVVVRPRVGLFRRLLGRGAARGDHVSRRALPLPRA